MSEPDHSPEGRSSRMKERWANEREQDRVRRNRETQPAPVVEADTIAEALGTRKNRLDTLEADLTRMDARIATFRERRQTANAKERIEIERELSSLAVSRDTLILMISEGRESLSEAQQRHQQAQRDAAHRLEDVLSSNKTAARAYREHALGMFEAIQTIEQNAKSVEVLGINLKSYLTQQAFAASIYEVQLAPRYLPLPGHGASKPTTLETTLEQFADNARMRRAELKKPNGGAR